MPEVLNSQDGPSRGTRTQKAHTLHTVATDRHTYTCADIHIHIYVYTYMYISYTYTYTRRLHSEHVAGFGL